MKLKKNFLILILLFVSILILPNKVNAEGTKEMYDWNSGTNHRLFFYHSTQKESGVPCLLKVHVYAKAGEKIKFATSGNGATMHLPSGGTQNVSVTRSNGSEGFIYSANQEKNKSYTYKVITAPETGVYTFDMTNQTKTSSGSQYPNVTVINSGDYAFNSMGYGNAYIAAWDIQVANDTGNINGRVWLDYVSVYRGYSSSISLTSTTINFHVLTSDGYKYRLKLSNFDPGGMLFFISTRGIIGKNSNEIIYKSVNQSDVPTTYLMPVPTDGETEFDSFGKIFFNEPSDDLPNDISKDKLNARITEELTYNDGQEVGVAKLAGIFKFVVSEPSTYTITIKNRDTNQIVRTISNTAVEGENTVIWDGKNNSGSYVAAGNYHAEVNVRNGEYHFILADVESLAGGLTIQSENNESKLYYNNADFGSTDASINGADSLKYNYKFGDLKLINTWTYTSSQSSIDLIVLDPADETKCVITGRVFNDKDNSSSYDTLKDFPMSGVKVYAEDGNGNRYEAKTVTNGEFAIIVPKGFTYTVGVDSDYRTTYLGPYVNTTRNETQTVTANNSVSIQSIGYYSALKKITVKKEWDDNNNELGYRSDSINVNIKNGDTIVENFQVKANAGWTKTVYLPEKDSSGNVINYTIEEDEISPLYKNENAIITVVNGIYTIINKYQIPNDTADLIVKKVWDDNNDNAEKRPDSINVKLYVNDVLDNENYVITKDNNWELTIEDKLVYDVSGNKINYRVEEPDTGSIFYQLEGIEEDNNVFTITNKFIVPNDTVDLTVKKVWNDNNNEAGKRPARVNALVYSNNESTEYELNDSNNWMVNINNQPVYDSKGNRISYRVEEPNTGSIFYQLDSIEEDNNTFTITNKFEVPDDKVNYTIEKVWNDNNNEALKRPASVKVKYYVNNESTEYELNESNNWMVTIDNQPVYDSTGNRISYRVEEPNTGSVFYQLDSIEENNNTFTITNKFVVPDDKINVKLTKKWDDIDNKDGIRPLSLKMRLMANNSLVGEYELTEDDNWSYMVRNLKRYDSMGNLIEYSIGEEDTEEYTIIDTTSNSSDDLIELSSTSKHRRLANNNRSSNSNDTSNEGVKGATESNPKTLDNITLFIAIFIMSLLGLTSIIVIKKKETN